MTAMMSLPVQWSVLHSDYWCEPDYRALSRERYCEWRATLSPADLARVRDWERDDADYTESVRPEQLQLHFPLASARSLTPTGRPHASARFCLPQRPLTAGPGLHVTQHPATGPQSPPNAKRGRRRREARNAQVNAGEGEITGGIMAKQLAYIQIRVEPVVSEPWGEETEEQHTRRVERIARELEEEIKRHCDNIGYITRFPYYECSHCGSAWETPPECCSEAVEETREKAKSSA